MRIFCKIILLIIFIIQIGCSVILFEKPSRETVSQLKQEYAVKLASTWKADQADELLKTFNSIFLNAEDVNKSTTSSVWKISKEVLEEDIYIESVQNMEHVTVSSEVFVSKESNEENSEEGNSQEIVLSNQRLYRVVAQFITKNWTNTPVVKLILGDGTDRNTIELVMKEMYGLSLVRKETPEAQYIGQKLHKYIGKIHLTQIKNKELMKLMSVYDKFPKGLNKIPKLKYLAFSQKAPYAGSAWIVADCVEYADRTFRIKNQNEFQRIIIHEKAHFLWEYALNGKFRKQWSELGGWYKDPNNKNRWLKSKDRKEFVTAYAYSKNPNEDWAESVAYYLIHPEKLRSVSQSKYDFVDRVMQEYSDGRVPFKRLQQLED